MYKAVIFDFFGVIHRDPFEHWLRQNGLERGGEIHEISKLFDKGNISLAEHHRRLSEHTGKPVQGIKDSFGDISFIDNDMVGLIKQLKANYRIGLLSNSGTEYIGRIIDKYDLAPLFDVMTISSEVGIIKPDPDIFHHILGELGVAIDEAVFIDDSQRNTGPASALGIKAFLYKGDVSKLKKELAAVGIKV